MDQNHLKKYNIYDFASKLFRKYDKNVANLHFDHVIFFVDYDPLLNSILNLTINSTQVKYQNYGKFVDYYLKKENQKLLTSFQNLIPIVKCLNDTYMKKTRFNAKFNNMYASKMNMRDGKSIFNTDLVQSVNQHWANNRSPGSKGINVPIADGFVSHIRDDLHIFVYKQSYPFEFLQFDFEYYLFLLSVSNRNF
jgi:hypothetical protein